MRVPGVWSGIVLIHSQRHMCYRVIGRFHSDMRINELLVRLTTLLMEQTAYDENRIYKDGKERAVITSPEKKNVSELKSYIDTHIKETLSLEQMAEKCILNKNYLAHLFKSAYGLFIGSCVQLARTGKAKELEGIMEGCLETYFDIDLDNGGDFVVS